MQAPLLTRLLFLLAVLLPGLTRSEDRMPVTVQQVIERIQARVGVPWSANTVDTLKAGDPAAPVTGVTVTMFATLGVLKQSVADGRNFIVCHEPTFYNHRDDQAPLKADAVLQAKLHYITDHGLAVFRFHDHIHCMKPDGIVAGIAETLGWQKFLRKGEQVIFDIEPATVKKLAKFLKGKLDARAVRVVGNEKMPCARIAVSVGAASTLDQIALLQRPDVDVLVCGETREWETVEYTRDAAALGKPKSLIVLGHVPSEEAGMRHCARWLSAFLPEVPVKFVPSGDPFHAP
jgi:putative NIF3 family GTP cyclohydrolase 1 type 2